MPVSESEEWPQQERPQRADPTRARDARTGSDAAAARVQHQTRWVDLQIQQAMERGEFDNLPGAGKPLGDLGSPHDRDWWLRKLVEREQITGVLPAALQLRKEDAELDRLLDREATEPEVRRFVEDFNRRVIEARRQLQGGPPVVTRTRDVDTEVSRWRERRRELQRRSAPRTRPSAATARSASPGSPGSSGSSSDREQRPRRRRWFRRR